MRRKTHEQFKQEIESKNRNIEVLGIYSNNKTRILFRCKVDGHEWETSPTSILSGKGCPKCAGVIKKTPTQFAEEAKKINPKIQIIGEYTNNRTRIKFRCLVDGCGHEWEAVPLSILRGSGCNKCGNKKISEALSKTDDYFKEILKRKNNSIINTEKYINARTPISFKCLVEGCGFEWRAKPNNITSTNSTGCPKCNGGIKRTKEEFNEMLKLKNPQIKPLGEYENNRKPIKFKCLATNCKHEWEARPYNILSGKGCPECARRATESKGSIFIGKLLEKYNYKFTREKRFKDCKNVKPLPFDYCIETKKGYILIEYQGEQHYKRKGGFWGGDHAFEEQQLRDNIKREYCEEKNIPLIEIPYWIKLEKLEEFLLKQLNQIIME